MMDTATAALAISARREGANVWFDGVNTDSRAVHPGQLFVAIRGERFDGHEFVAKAFERGAVAALVAEETLAKNPGLASDEAKGLLAVADPIAALGALAEFWRRRFTLPAIGVVGSNGKTTVKEMIAAILRREYGTDRVLATAGNFNNAIGLPLTVLRLRAADVAAVFEIGMNHAGETAALAAIAQPTIALINNAQREHQEFMKSVDDVAAEHATLFDALPDDGTAIINADDAHAVLWRKTVAMRNARGSAIRIVDFGLREAAAVSATVRAQPWGHVVDLTTPQGSATFELRAPGTHNVMNALAATAASITAGVTLESVANALSAFRPAAGRLEVKTAANGATVFDDTYNANPDSVRAAIAVLAQAPGRKWLLLGDMGEVGAQGETFHREIGAYARDAQIDRLFATGTMMRYTVESFGSGGEHFASVDALVEALVAGRISPRDAVLIKGSRFMRMERVVAALTGVAAGASGGSH